MEDNKRFHGGKFESVKEKLDWIDAARKDGFKCLWTWIYWVVNQYIYADDEGGDDS